MIKVSINKKFQGLYPIRDKYVKQAEQNKEDIEITVRDTGEVVVIPKDKLRSLILFTKSGFKDKFSDEVHNLVYYSLKPINKDNLKLL